MGYSQGAGAKPQTTQKAEVMSNRDPTDAHDARVLRTLDTPTCWLVFECLGSSRRNLLAEKPTKEAAEMWLVSCA